MPELGHLLAIGGHEDHEGDRVILRRIAELLGGGDLALVTAASSSPEKYVERYRASFSDLGVTVVPVPADETAAMAVLERTRGVFMTGGKQHKLVRRLTPAMVEGMRQLRARGGVIAGTSAGASALADRMLLRGPGRDAPSGDDLEFGAGLGFVTGVIIDQHFTQRGRGGRLRSAVAADPSRIGIGIDEDTAAEFTGTGTGTGTTVTALGSGGVTIVDAREGETRPAGSERRAMLRAARLDVLASGDTYDLTATRA